VKLFLAASVALAAAGQKTGASRAIFDLASAMGWELQASNYVLREVAANLQRFSPLAAHEWPTLAARLSIVRDLSCFDYPAVFSPGKGWGKPFRSPLDTITQFESERPSFGLMVFNRAKSFGS
jgi:hypothetical protein